MTTSRREFLITAVSGLGASLLAPACGGPMDDDEKPPGPDVDDSKLPETKLELQAVVDGYFEEADPMAVRRVGEAYLQRFGTDDEAALEDLSKPVEAIADVEDMTKALETLDARVIADFEAPELASVKGWQLARTEARMCGLAQQLAG